MSQIVCGRCGRLTAEHSTYCPNDRWTLWQNAPDGDARVAQELARMALPRGVSGFLSRRRDESHRGALEKQIRTVVDKRLEKLEERVEKNPLDGEAQHELGLVALLDENPMRAQAHFESARRLLPTDLQVAINFSVVLALRGRWQQCIELLREARQTAPDNPQVLMNLALCAVGARRPELALEAVDALEKLWLTSPELSREFHDDGQSARGIALLQLGRARDARLALQHAARHTSAPPSTPATPVASMPVVAASARVSNVVKAPPETENDNDDIMYEARDEWGNTMEGTYDGEFVPSQETRNAQNGLTEVKNVESESASEQLANLETDGLTELLAGEGIGANADLLINLAIVEADTGDPARAIGRLLAALRLEPGHSRALNNLGVLAYRGNEFVSALRFLELAQQMEEAAGSVTPQIMSHLGVVLAANGRYAEGLEALTHAAGHEAAEFEVQYNTGRAFIEQGKPDRGVDFLRQAFASNPNHADIHAVLGAAYLLRGRPELVAQAIQHLRRALQLNANHRAAYADLTLAFGDTGDAAPDATRLEAARKTLEAGLKSHARAPELLFLLGLSIMSIGDEVHFAQAAKVFDGARTAGGEFPAALYNSGLCVYLMGLRDNASKVLEEVTVRDPAFAPAYYLIGVGHATVKRFDEALKAWKQAEKFEAGNPDLQANMGFVYYRRGEYDNAIAHYFKAHRAAPNEPILLTALGLAYARVYDKTKDERQFGKALECFKQSLALDDLSPVTHMNIGLAYYIHNQPEISIDHWRRVSQLDADYYKRIEELENQTGKRSYDDTFIQLRPLNWRTRVVGLSPVLPNAHTQLLPGDNLQAYRLAISDPQLQKVREARREMKRLDRALAWGNVK